VGCQSESVHSVGEASFNGEGQAGKLDPAYSSIYIANQMVMNVYWAPCMPSAQRTQVRKWQSWSERSHWIVGQSPIYLNNYTAHL
jgi:hypothetical protein